MVGGKDVGNDEEVGWECNSWNKEGKGGGRGDTGWVGDRAVGHRVVGGGPPPSGWRKKSHPPPPYHQTRKLPKRKKKSLSETGTRRWGGGPPKKFNSIITINSYQVSLVPYGACIDSLANDPSPHHNRFN